MKREHSRPRIFDLAAIVTVVLFVGLAINSCASTITPTDEDQQTQKANTAFVAYPPGEYITASPTPAAITAVDYVLIVKAIERHDLKSVRVLHGEGSAFNLPKGTRVILLPAKVGSAELRTSVVGSVGDLKICIATIESGDRIGTEVALGCEGLNSASR